MTKATVTQCITEGKCWEVNLDDIRVLYAQSFDDELGVVTAPLVTDDGLPVFDHDREDYAIVERKGDVAFYELPVHKKSRGGLPKQVMTALAQVSPFNVKHALPGELGENWNIPKPWLDREKVS